MTHNDTNWQELTQACITLGVSKRTLYRWIKQGKVKERIIDNMRQILVSEIDTMSKNDTDKDKLIDQLKSEIDYLRKELSESRERSDSIIMTMTKQIEDQRLMLTEAKKPFWKRLFKSHIPS